MIVMNEFVFFTMFESKLETFNFSVNIKTVFKNEYALLKI